MAGIGAADDAAALPPGVNSERDGDDITKKKIGLVLLVFLRLCCYKESATKGRKNTYEQRRKKVRWESSSPAPIFSVSAQPKAHTAQMHWHLPH